MTALSLLGNGNNAGAPGPAGEQALVAASQAGDNQAFERLYYHHVDRVHGLVRRLVSGRPDTDDIVQQVFLEAYRSLSRFRGESSFATWIYRIAVNVSMQHLRTAKRRQVDCHVELDETLLSAHDIDPESQVQTRQLYSEVVRHLATLQPKFRVAFVLRHVEGLSLAEIADIVDANEPAVGQRVRKAGLLLARKIERARRRSKPTGVQSSKGDSKDEN